MPTLVGQGLEVRQGAVQLQKLVYTISGEELQYEFVFGGGSVFHTVFDNDPELAVMHVGEEPTRTMLVPQEIG